MLEVCWDSVKNGDQSWCYEMSTQYYIYDQAGAAMKGLSEFTPCHGSHLPSDDTCLPHLGTFRKTGACVVRAIRIGAIFSHGLCNHLIGLLLHFFVDRAKSRTAPNMSLATKQQQDKTRTSDAQVNRHKTLLHFEITERAECVYSQRKETNQTPRRAYRDSLLPSTLLCEMPPCRHRECRYAVPDVQAHFLSQVLGSQLPAEQGT